MSFALVYAIGLVLVFFGTLVFFGWSDPPHKMDLDFIGSCITFAALFAVAWPVLVLVGLLASVSVLPLKFGMWLGKVKS